MSARDPATATAAAAAPCAPAPEPTAKRGRLAPNPLQEEPEATTTTTTVDDDNNPTPTTTTTLLDLPNELLGSIAALPRGDVVGLRRVCRQLRDVLPAALPLGPLLYSQLPRWAPAGQATVTFLRPKQWRALGAPAGMWGRVGAIGLRTGWAGWRKIGKMLTMSETAKSMSARHLRHLRLNTTKPRKPVPVDLADMERLCANLLGPGSRLATLEMEQSRLSDAAALCLASALEADPSHLTHLALVKCMLSPDSLDRLLLALAANTTITAIDLTASGLGDAGAAALAQTLERRPAVRRLCLDDNHITDTGGQLLAEALPHSRVEEISLAGNEIGDETATMLSLWYVALDATTTINLADNQIADAGVFALTMALHTKVSNSRVTKLNLANNRIRDLSAYALTVVLRTNTHVTELDLRANRIGNITIEEIPKGLAALVRDNRTLTKLDISANPLGEKYLLLLADALKDNTTLKWLGLGSVGGRERSGVALGQALLGNTTLEYLSLDIELDGNRNYFGNATAIAFAKVIESSPALRYLGMCGCMESNQINVDDEGVSALVAALQKNTRLEFDFCLRAAKVSEAVQDALKAVLTNPKRRVCFNDEGEYDDENDVEVDDRYLNPIPAPLGFAIEFIELVNGAFQ